MWRGRNCSERGLELIQRRRKIVPGLVIAELPKWAQTPAIAADRDARVLGDGFQLGAARHLLGRDGSDIDVVTVAKLFDLRSALGGRELRDEAEQPGIAVALFRPPRAGEILGFLVLTETDALAPGDKRF